MAFFHFDKLRTPNFFFSLFVCEPDSSEKVRWEIEPRLVIFEIALASIATMFNTFFAEFNKRIVCAFANMGSRTNGCGLKA
jgi:hypothetical protein